MLTAQYVALLELNLPLLFGNLKWHKMQDVIFKKNPKKQLTKIREEKVPYLLVGLEEGHYVVKWIMDQDQAFPAFPPLTTILVINLCLLTSFSFFSSLTIQSSRGNLSVLSYSLGSIMSLTQSLFFSFLFFLWLLHLQQGSAKWTTTEIQATWEWTWTRLYCTCLNAPVPCV